MSAIVKYGGGFIAVAVALGVIVSMLEPNQPPEGKEEMVAQTVHKPDDAQQIATAHQIIARIESKIEDARKTFESDAGNSLRAGNRFAMYDAAKAFRTTLMEADEQLRSPAISPHLTNTDAEKALHDAGEDAGMAVSYRLKAVETFMQAADSGELRPSSASAIHDANQMANYSSAQEALAIVRAYAAVGIDISRIDVENGGILSTKKPPASGRDIP